MLKTPSKMHMYDMVKIDIVVFEIVGEGEAYKALPPPPIVSCLKYPGSDNNNNNNNIYLKSNIQSI